MVLTISVCDLVTTPWDFRARSESIRKGVERGINLGSRREFRGPLSHYQSYLVLEILPYDVTTYRHRSISQQEQRDWSRS